MAAFRQQNGVNAGIETLMLRYDPAWCLFARSQKCSTNGKFKFNLKSGIQ